MAFAGKVSQLFGIISRRYKTLSVKRLYSLIRSENLQPNIKLITLNDPKKANCLSLSLLKELKDELRNLQSSTDIHALIISGEGRYFCAGHHLQELLSDSNEDPAEIFSICSDVMQLLTSIPMPSIAAVNGPAVAAGCQLVAACDLAVSGESAVFSTPGIKVGFFCSTPAVPLIRAIGLRAAKELLLTGRQINAQRAFSIGLVHRVVPDNQVQEGALNLAKEITQHSHAAVCLGRRYLHEQASMELPVAYDIATKAMLENLKLNDTQRGIKSFVDKKPLPKWSHRNE